MKDFIQLNCNGVVSHTDLWIPHVSWLQSTLNLVSNSIEKKALGHDDGGEPFQVLENGIAIIPITGVMMKGNSFFGGTNTLRTKNAIRQAVLDPDVKAILLNIDSGGGTVAGTMELANDVRMADSIKPVFTQVSDMMASAALWVGVQARGVFANPLAEIGSIGVVAVIADFSEMMKNDGIKVHVISTGKFKGAGVFGSEITDEQIEDIQNLVNQINEFFVKAVAKGRGMKLPAVRAIADGRVHLAAKAMELGLIDGIQSIDETIKTISKAIRNVGSSRERAEVRLRLAENNL